VKRLALSVAISSLGIFVTSAFAGNVSLNDWCFNVTGDLSTCNGSGSSNPAVDLSGFDTSLVPNSLGVATITLGPGSNQYVGLYADYDIDYADYLSYNDNASTTNALDSPDQSYSIGNPNVYNGISSPSGYTLFDAFANDALDDSNTAGTPNSGLPQCCDIAFAMAFSNINVALGGSAIITFDVSFTAPSGGFYVTQSSNDPTQPSIYLSGDVDLIGGSSTPEPSTFLLTAGALAVAGFLARRRRAASFRLLFFGASREGL